MNNALNLRPDRFEAVKNVIGTADREGMFLIDAALNLMHANAAERNVIMKYCVLNIPFDNSAPMRKKQFRKVKARFYYMLNYEIALTDSEPAGQKKSRKKTPEGKKRHERKPVNYSGNDQKACGMGFSKLPESKKGTDGKAGRSVTADNNKSSIHREQPKKRKPANGKPCPPAGK